MSFELKNDEATYQLLANMMFAAHIEKTIEVYVEDMLVKSKPADDHIHHLKESFDILKKYKMKLKQRKCVFGVAFGKFLGSMVNQRGIEVNPNKIRAILEVTSPKSIKDV